jgi:hypothetical protein
VKSEPFGDRSRQPRALPRLVIALEAGVRDAGSKAGAGRTGRILRLSAARRATLKLQGQYMGYLRGLTSRQKKEVKAPRSTKGVQAAITLARRLKG